MSFYNQTLPQLELTIKNTHQLWVTLKNPDQMNAITIPMIDSLTSVLNHADFDPQIRVVVLTGSGKSFCAGGDIKSMEEKSGMFAGESNELRSRYQHGIQRIPQCFDNLSVPVIALVNGPAIGAGCDLSMMCDLRVGGSKARFAETFTRMGLVPGDGGTFFLQRVIGYAKAMQMFLTAQSFEGKAALDFGLLNFLFEDSELVTETEKLAERIAGLAPVAMALTKKAMRASYLHDLQTSLDMLASFQGIAQRTHDHFEAIHSFKEKRDPNFSGK